MNMLQKLSQSFLVTRTPTLYSNVRIVGVNSLRQFATATTTTTKSKPPKSKSKSTRQKSKPDILIPAEPKRPLSAYSLFYRDFFREKHKDNPEYKVTEIAKLAGARWGKLPEEEKNIYVERHNKAVSDYKKSHQEWLDSLTSEQIAEENRRRKEVKRGKKAKKIIKDPNLPKKPRTPYMNFIIERMHTLGGKGPDRILELAMEWNNLNDVGKKPYQEAYVKDKLRYAQEMETFNKMIQGKQ